MGVPQNIIVPFVGVEFDSSRAFQGPATLPVQVLLFGQKLSGGTGATETLLLVTSADQVGELAGFGSVVHRMAISYFANNKTTTTYIMLLDDAGGATAAQTDLVVTGTATANGEVDLYIDGDRYAVGVTSGDTNTTVSAAIMAAVNADPNTPVVASEPVAGTVRLTAKNAGIAAGDIDVRYNYNDGEVLPAGISIADPANTPGTVDPDVQDVLDNIGDAWFNVLAAPYNDATSLEAIETFLTNNAGPLVQKDGMYYFAKKDTRANLITFATNSARNNPYVTMLDGTNRPSSNAMQCAAVAGRTAESIESDTAVPLHRMALAGLLPIASEDRYTLIERNQLAVNGIATMTDDNGVQTESTVTMYLKNSANASDIAYQFQNTVFILMRLRYTFVNRIKTKYARAKLANSTQRLRSGQQVITPAIGKAEAVAWFLLEEELGQVENVEQFKNDVVCERNLSNPNRLDWILPPDLINQFIVGSADMQFLLESPA